MCKGKVPFIDFYEINPPLMSILSIPPYLLFTWFSVPSNKAMFIYLFLYATISVSWCVSMLKRFLAEDEWFDVGPMLAALVVAISLHNLWQMGQREQFFFLLFLPYFILRWWRTRGGEPPAVEAMLAGFFAGIGCLIKPIYVLVPAAIEIGFCLRHRDHREILKPEIAGLCLAAVAYAAYFLSLPQEALKNFLFVHIPFILKYYRCYNAPLSDVASMLQAKSGLVLGLGGALGVVLLKGSHPLMVPLLFLLGSSYAAYLLQMKGWMYQAIPVEWSAALLCGLVVGNSLRIFVLRECTTDARDQRQTNPPTEMARRLYRIHFVAVLAGAMALAVASIVCLRTKTQPPYSPVKEFLLRETKKGDSILVFGDANYYRYPAFLDADRELATRYCDMYAFRFASYALSIAQNDSELNEAHRIDTEISANLLSDVQTRKPRFILIDVAANTNPSQHGFLRIDDELKNKILVGYKFLKKMEISKYVDLEIYERTDR